MVTYFLVSSLLLRMDQRAIQIVTIHRVYISIIARFLMKIKNIFCFFFLRPDKWCFILIFLLVHVHVFFLLGQYHRCVQTGNTNISMRNPSPFYVIHRVAHNFAQTNVCIWFLRQIFSIAGVGNWRLVGLVLPAHLFLSGKCFISDIWKISTFTGISRTKCFTDVW